MDLFVRFLNPVLMIAAGIGLGVFLAAKFRLDWRIFGIGAATFIAAQVLHIPFNNIVLRPALESAGMTAAPEGVALIVVGLAFGLSAGLFEEVARFIVYRRWLKEARTWREGLMYGAGHGGAEAIILGAFTLLTVIQLVTLQDADLSTIVPPEQLEQAQMQVEQFWALPWYAVFLGTVERLAALCLHLAMSLMVLQAFTRNNKLWLAAAIGWHTLVDAVAVVSVQRLSIYATEGLIILLALISVWIVFRLRTEEPEESGPTENMGGKLPRLNEIQPAELSEEDIDASRYE